MTDILATWEAEIRRIRVEASLGKKASKTTSQQTNQAWLYRSIVLRTYVGRFQPETRPRKRQDSI
jgi:hypothetical protein